MSHKKALNKVPVLSDKDNNRIGVISVFVDSKNKLCFTIDKHANDLGTIIEDRELSTIIQDYNLFKICDISSYHNYLDKVAF